MRAWLSSLVRACVLALFVFAAIPALAQAPFTYQGRLDIDGQPYTGSVWLQCTLWNAPTEGLLLAPPNVRPNVDVRDGLFTVELDFGVEVLEEESYLQLGVSNTGQGIFVPLLPRQAMRGAPIATVARNAAGWSTDAKAARSYTIVSFSTAALAVPFAPGTTLTQTFVTPEAGLLRSISMVVDADGEPAEFALAVERAGVAIATALVTVPDGPTTQLTEIHFDIPAAIAQEEQLRVVARPLTGTLRASIVASPTDVYTGGASSYVFPSPNVTFTDVVLSVGISQLVSTNALAAEVGGGSLVLRSPIGTSILQVSDGPVASAAYLEFMRGATRGVLIGKDPAGNFIFDVGTTRAITMTPQSDMTVFADVTMVGTLTALQTASLQGLTAAGPATFNAGAAFNGGATFASSATMLGVTSLLGQTNVGSVAAPSSLGVFGSAEVNSGSLLTAPPVTFRINHANPTTTGWPIRIDNPAVASFAGGVRLSGAGFLEVTNRAGSGLSTGFARLDGTGTWSAVSDARLKAAIEEASSEGLLAAALKVRPVTYFFTHEDAGSRVVPHVGVLAQELREVLPDLVRDDGSYMTVNYAQLSVVAIGAIKAQQDRIVAQEAVIEAQQREIESMRERLDAIERAIRAESKD